MLSPVLRVSSKSTSSQLLDMFNTGLHYLFKKFSNSTIQLVDSTKKLWFKIIRINSKTKRVLLALFGIFLVYRHYRKKIRVLTSHENPENLHILKYLEPTLDRYSPTFYLCFPHLVVINGGLNFGVKWNIQFMVKVVFPDNDGIMDGDCSGPTSGSDSDIFNG